MASKPSGVSVTFVDDPNAPDLFADGVSGIAYLHGNIRITLESARVNHEASPGPISRVVVGRVVLPLSAAENLRDLLSDYINRLKQQPSAPPPPVQGPRSLQ
jgi:hypothetical protein